MFNRFKKELHEFLIQHNISDDTSIFHDVILKIAEVKAREKHHSRAMVYGDENSIHFHIPTMSLTELRKLLALLQISEDEYETDSRLNINARVMFEILMPRFKEYVNRTMRETPNELRHYVIESKRKLEMEAIERMQTSADALLDELNNADERNNLNPTLKELSSILFELIGAIDRLAKKSHYYTYVTATQEKLNRFCDAHISLRDNEKLKPHFAELYDALATYTKYNRAESAIAVNMLFKDIDVFFPKYLITCGRCDIFEETLLKMAGITNPPKKCHFDKGYDRTRLILTITGMNKDDAKLFLKYFQDAGDDTAKETGGAYYGSRAESAWISEGYSEPVKKAVEEHSFDIDGQIMFTVIYPRLKKQIESWADNNPENLKAYQDKSKEFFDGKCAEEITSLVKDLQNELATCTEDKIAGEVETKWLKDNLAALLAVMKSDKCHADFPMKVKERADTFQAYADLHNSFFFNLHLPIVVKMMDLLSLLITYNERISRPADDAALAAKETVSANPASLFHRSEQPLLSERELAELKEELTFNTVSLS